MHTLEGAANVLCLAFAPNEKLLATGSTDKTVRTWNLAPALARWESAGKPD